MSPAEEARPRACCVRIVISGELDAHTIDELCRRVRDTARRQLNVRLHYRAHPI